MTFGDKDSIFLKTEHLVPPSVPPPRAGLPSSRARRRPRLSRAPSPTRRGRRREELGPQPPALSALELPLPSFSAPRLPQPGSPRASAWAPRSESLGAHCSACGRVGAPPLRSWSPLVLPPSPGAGHEEPPGAAQRPAGCAHTSPAADGDMSSAHRVPRPAASPIRRRPAGQRCPGE
ncbi:U1 small nuclear ribonucleoprotein C-like [Piliocolobus tephrosceles]|uniref:U1 small nuclear ribonucleoprotein C-like n=1 Tax=Piliocolobus tephrosceles TaxID=591936 RepID=UPI000C2A2F27|nr:U1 small nuclear ribonucleoprotein C-like [Piliocolobus tephrosceles]